MSYSLTLRSPADLRLDGVEDMMAAHWQEVCGYKAEAPLSFDWSRAHRHHRIGLLRCYRLDKDKRFIGYNFFVISPQYYHAMTTWAFNQGIYIMPEERKAGAGTFIIRQAEEELKKLGVKIVSYHDSAHHDNSGLLGRMLERLGYQKDAELYGKAL